MTDQRQRVEADVEKAGEPELKEAAGKLLSTDAEMSLGVSSKRVSGRDLLVTNEIARVFSADGPEVQEGAAVTVAADPSEKGRLEQRLRDIDRLADARAHMERNFSDLQIKDGKLLLRFSTAGDYRNSLTNDLAEAAKLATASGEAITLKLRTPSYSDQSPEIVVRPGSDPVTLTREFIAGMETLSRNKFTKPGETKLPVLKDGTFEISFENGQTFYTPESGSDLKLSIDRLLKQAAVDGLPRNMRFNNSTIKISPGDTIDAKIKEVQAAQEAYYNSPEYRGQDERNRREWLAELEEEKEEIRELAKSKPRPIEQILADLKANAEGEIVNEAFSELRHPEEIKAFAEHLYKTQPENAGRLIRFASEGRFPTEFGATQDLWAAEIQRHESGKGQTFTYRSEFVPNAVEMAAEMALKIAKNSGLPVKLEHDLVSIEVGPAETVEEASERLNNERKTLKDFVGTGLAESEAFNKARELAAQGPVRMVIGDARFIVRPSDSIADIEVNYRQALEQFEKSPLAEARRSNEAFILKERLKAEEKVAKLAAAQLEVSEIAKAEPRARADFFKEMGLSEEGLSREAIEKVAAQVKHPQEIRYLVESFYQSNPDYAGSIIRGLVLPLDGSSAKIALATERFWQTAINEVETSKGLDLALKIGAEHYAINAVSTASKLAQGSNSPILLSYDNVLITVGPQDDTIELTRKLNQLLDLRANPQQLPTTEIDRRTPLEQVVSDTVAKAKEAKEPFAISYRGSTILIEPGLRPLTMEARLRDKMLSTSVDPEQTAKRALALETLFSQTKNLDPASLLNLLDPLQESPNAKDGQRAHALAREIENYRKAIAGDFPAYLERIQANGGEEATLRTLRSMVAVALGHSEGLLPELEPKRPIADLSALSTKELKEVIAPLRESPSLADRQAFARMETYLSELERLPSENARADILKRVQSEIARVVADTVLAPNLTNAKLDSGLKAATDSLATEPVRNRIGLTALDSARTESAQLKPGEMRERISWMKDHADPKVREAYGQLMLELEIAEALEANDKYAERLAEKAGGKEKFLAGLSAKVLSKSGSGLMVGTFFIGALAGLVRQAKEFEEKY